MDILQQFMTYAGDFEKTLADDDWSRLEPYFAEDAVYEVKAPSAAFGCRLVGREAIFRGIKKSLDGFDRKFSRRDIDVTSGPEIEGDELRLGWAVTYHREGLTPFVLRGRSAVRYRDGRIAHLADDYDAGVEEELRTWQKTSGVALDPSYT
jgi:hypothetical protein